MSNSLISLAQLGVNRTNGLQQRDKSTGYSRGGFFGFFFASHHRFFLDTSPPNLGNGPANDLLTGNSRRSLVTNGFLLSQTVKLPPLFNERGCNEDVS